MSSAIEKTVEQVFEEFDTNKNGYLESGELKKFIEAVISAQGLTVELNDEEIKKVVDQFDANHDGKVDKG